MSYKAPDSKLSMLVSLELDEACKSLDKVLFVDWQ